jgi:hypothetical protein
MNKHIFFAILGIILNAIYIYEWLGPKGGEGSYKGLGNAMAMLAVTVVCLVAVLIIIAYLAIKRIPYRDGKVIYTEGIIFAIPIVITLIFVAYNGSKNGY